MIPQTNPLSNYMAQKPAIDRAISRVLSSGRYILGEESRAFEQEFADYIGVQYAVATGTGTDALHLALRSCGIGPGDEVITVSHTAVATIAAIEMCGASPVLVDIDPDLYTIKPEQVEKAVTVHTKAIVPVHLYGQPSQMTPLMACAKRNNLFIVEDCAQSHGAVYQGLKAGSLGDAGAFSFYPTKNLGCLGDGGVVTTNSDKLHEKLLALRQYGWDNKRISRMAGYNSRLDELQASILRVKLRRLDPNNRRRIEIAQAYNRFLESKEIVRPFSSSSSLHVYHQYVIRCVNRSIRDDLIRFMLKQNIQTAVHYPVPVHLQPAYMNRIRKPHPLHITEKISETIISLPMFPELGDEEIEKIAATICEFYG